MKRIIVIILVVAVLVGCGRKTPVPASRLQQQDGRFSFVTPDGWFRYEIGKTGRLMISSHPDDDGAKIFVDNIVTGALQAVAQQTVNRTRSHYSSYSVSTQETFVTSSGLSGVKIIGVRKAMESGPLLVLHYLVENDGYVTRLQCWCLDSSRQIYEVTFDEAMRSIESEGPTQQKTSGSLFTTLTRPSDELRTAVRSFYDAHARTPSNVQELSVHAVSNSLPLDATAYGTVTFVHSNDYIQIEYRKGWSSGQCFVYLKDDIETNGLTTNITIEGIVAHFYKTHGRLPTSIPELKEHVQESRLDFDLDRYKSVSVKKKMFGRVRISSVWERGPRSGHGSYECDLSELEDLITEQNIGQVSPEAAQSASPDEPSM